MLADNSINYSMIKFAEKILNNFKMGKKDEALHFFMDAVVKDEESKELFFEFCPEAKEEPFFYEL